MKKLDNLSFLIVAILLIVNVLVWTQIIFRGGGGESQFSFLDVGQGDGTLGVFEGGVKFLVDAGPSAKIVSALEEVLGSSDKYIDLAMITHPQLDHFGGFNFILEKYNIGAFVINGREADLPEWRELLDEIRRKKIPLLTLGARDRIIYQDNSIDFLSPDGLQLQSAEPNDSSLVGLVRTPKARVFLAGDISANVEKYLTGKFDAENFRADILKIPHHGSKYSSSQSFLEIISPKIAVIEVGKNNYGHPAPEVLDRLERNSTPVFRTDISGTLNFRFSDRKISVFGSR